eukprot:TRINITY_DN6774_c0_g1_i12.p1 TRINITY_DN6774_c0_g1~~TRINITY_DN6774_c0_g1_i12.p1  ORF type:complete len:387 (-),score=73.37 TRINITY_DN6774_c0_g1_i12:41-1201(-)
MQPSETVKKGCKRKQVRRACATCAAAHVACSETRPCCRCVKRGIQCLERERKKRRKGEGEDDPNIHYLPGIHPFFPMVPGSLPLVDHPLVGYPSGFYQNDFSSNIPFLLFHDSPFYLFMSGAQFHGAPPGIQPFSDPLQSSGSGIHRERDVGPGSLEDVPRYFPPVFPFSLGTKLDNSVEGFSDFVRHRGLTLDSPFRPLSAHVDDKGLFPPPSVYPVPSGGIEESTPNIPPVKFLTPPTPFLVVPPVSTVFSPSTAHSVHSIPVPPSSFTINTTTTTFMTTSTTTATTTTTTTTTTTNTILTTTATTFLALTTTPCTPTSPTSTTTSVFNHSSNGRECPMVKHEALDPLFVLLEPCYGQFEAPCDETQSQPHSLSPSQFQTEQEI